MITISILTILENLIEINYGVQMIAFIFTKFQHLDSK